MAMAYVGDTKFLDLMAELRVAMGVGWLKSVETSPLNIRADLDSYCRSLEEVKEHVATDAGLTEGVLNKQAWLKAVGRELGKARTKRKKR